MRISDVIAELRRDSGFMANVTAWETLPSHPGRLEEIPAGLHPDLARALQYRKIQRLYSHQAETFSHALGGRSVAVVTPTASGKTLCYTLPVLHALLNDASATALYLFPTKALAHDQLAEIGDWIAAIGAGQGPASGNQIAHFPQIAAHCFDGDTPSAQRSSVRATARLILTNPDMLHSAILPYHGGWERFLAGLRYIVIDEMHSYRGVFGSHVANVLRRLRRVATHYGSRHQFLLTSATIANPKQLAETLTEQPVQVIVRNGAPRGEKHILLYAPPLYDPVQGLRRSSVLETQELAVRFLQAGLQTIVFGRARLTVELLLSYIREHLQKKKIETKKIEKKQQKRDGVPLSKLHAPLPAVRGYRGGYLPQERRQIEAGLRVGDVRGVVATNALELGIDIGQLEAALICGYPGTIAAAWQQWGRAGRTTETSLAVLVATAGALDQYIVNHPQFLLQRSPEHAFANPDNLFLLVDQMRCAAFELPFAQGERFGRSPFTDEVLEILTEEGSVRHVSSAAADRGPGMPGASFLWSGDSYPAHQLSLRSASGDPVSILAGDSNENAIHSAVRNSGSFTTIGEVDAASAPFLIHEGAVYLHEGASYLVERLDLDEKRAWVWPAKVDYYTEASSETAIRVLSVQASRLAGGALLGHGELLVTSQVTQYRRVRRFSHENLGVLPLEFPPTTLDTAGYWLEITAETQLALMQAGDWRDTPTDYGPDWPQQRARTRAAYSYRCAECGAPEKRERQHDVHHRTPFRAFGYVPGLNRNDLEANRLSNLVLLCRRCHQRLEAGLRARTGMDGVAYALGNLAPLHLMCDRRDIDVAIVRGENENEREEANASLSSLTPADSSQITLSAPRIYIYECIPAGIGFSSQLYERHDDLVAGAVELIHGCGCRYGCPACVGPVLLAGDEQRPVLETKRLALALLAALSDA